MSNSWSRQRWANSFTVILNQVFADTPARFPVDVIALAKEVTHQKFPDDPITLVQGAPLDGFDGALYRAPTGKKGWGIIYNDAIVSPGRINFTLAHELGHYLLHRFAHPDGIECGSQDIVRWDSDYREIEQQANEFAAYLLMPLDDFRRQIDPRTKPTLEDLGACADRYKVSLISAALRWLEYTERRSVLVISRDAYILWARSSTAALKTGAYFKTAGRPPIAIPETSLVLRPDLLDSSKVSMQHDIDTWFGEPCEELSLLSDRYDFAISLIHLEKAAPRWERDDEETEDVFDKFSKQ